MPTHFFYRALHLDFESAVRANPENQNCSMCPRYWYVDAVFPCDRCGEKFGFTAEEQHVWYEEYGFWVDSLPKHCLSCRRALRELKAARKEYDRHVEEALRSGDAELKKRIALVIDQLYELGGELPSRINENRRRLARQLERTKPSG
ncbi:MAG TPA: zinc-ribbon domain containing protein [Vicinamibacteria bacterium]|nr:zinc-ribbon domain containing protein [Vicinamibacteria bacterium]